MSFTPTEKATHQSRVKKIVALHKEIETREKKIGELEKLNERLEYKILVRSRKHN
jgi:hypothetical protein